MASLARRPCFAPLGLPVAWTDLKRLKGFVEEAAEGLLCLTGAGFSTESGIPDYRSPEGSYSKGHKPMSHQELPSSRL